MGHIAHLSKAGMHVDMILQRTFNPSWGQRIAPRATVLAIGNQQYVKMIAYK